MPGYERTKDGFRFAFGGLKTNDSADAIDPSKSPYCQNVRSFGGHAVLTRPGYEFLFLAGGDPITDIRAYAELDSDDEPRFLCRNTQNKIYVNADSGTIAATLSGTGLGVSMLPFRPNASIEPWMYIAATEDYKKFSTPDADNHVTVQNVGIEEQHQPPDACPDAFSYYDFSGIASGWGNTGTAGTVTNVDHWGSLNICGDAVLPDPASGPHVRYSVEVDSSFDYQRGMVIQFDPGGSPYTSIVEDVIPAVNNGAVLTIDAIYYYSGTTGRCVIVPTPMPISGVPSISGNVPTSASIFQSGIMSTLRRGALVSLNGSETCFVLSASTGPSGQPCFEVETTGTFAAGDTIEGLPAIVVCDVNPSIANTTMLSPAINSTVTTGDGILTHNLSPNPFNQLLSPANTTPQEADYVSLNIKMDTVDEIDNILISFTLSTNGDALNYSITPSEIIGTAAVAAVATAAQVEFPISALTRVGNNPTLTLADALSLVVTVTANASCQVEIGSVVLGGGGQPDVGTQGSPYFYSNITRSSDTGVPSNPSPITRYGVSPRRQNVIITNTDDVGDTQGNQWRQYRYGGAVTSFRFIGSIPNDGYADQFTDAYSDAAALGGSVIEYDNFQPWPTIDAPYTAQPGTVDGVTTTITVVGTVVLVTYSSASAFTDPAPATITRWLPGTLMLLGGQSAYTLWNRPTLITLAAPPAAFYYAYEFNLVENAGSISPDYLLILEPNVAAQPLPYLVGPDAQGVVFGCGDPFRPGRFYYAKSYAPDSAPDVNSQELTPPSEPLLGGETIDGLSFMGSPDRWWALYPQIGNTVQPYQAIERPVGRGLAAPFGHCTDGRTGFFWAKDGIWAAPGFGVGFSLTDADLYNLFPHEGVAGRNVTYAGKTIYAPDYARAGAFRLSFGAGFLYADYLDTTGTPRTLVADLTVPDATGSLRARWIIDVYADPIRCHYAVEQQAGTVLTEGTTYPRLVMGGQSGNVYEQAPLSNDNVTPIDGKIATFEDYGGDLRQDNLFNDAFLDFTPVSGIDVTPISGGTAAASTSQIDAASTRQQTNVPVGLELKYMGVLLEWTDDFDEQSAPTTLYAWQPMLQGVPIAVFRWKTQGTSFGLLAYFHIRQINFAYRSAGTADVTLTITVYDGTSPDPITLPGTSGQLRKVMFPLTFNKGMLYFFEGACDEEWQAYVSECEFYVGEWNRQESYKVFRGIEAPTGIS